MDKSSGYPRPFCSFDGGDTTGSFLGLRSNFLPVHLSCRRCVNHPGEHYNQFIPFPFLRLSILILPFFWCVGEDLFVSLFLQPGG